MTDPASSGAAGAAAFKAVGGASAVAAGGAGLAAIVVMLMTPPRSSREWAVGLISTVVASIGGGAATIEHFGLQHWVNAPIGLCAMDGLIFACLGPSLVQAGRLTTTLCPNIRVQYMVMDRYPSRQSPGSGAGQSPPGGTRA